MREREREEFTERVCMHYLAMLQHQMFKVCVCVCVCVRSLLRECVCITLLCYTHTHTLHRSSSHLKHTTLISLLPQVIGSSDALGSPINFVGGLGTGVYDFFHEPAKVCGSMCRLVEKRETHTHTHTHTQRERERERRC